MGGREKGLVRTGELEQGRKGRKRDGVKANLKVHVYITLFYNASSIKIQNEPPPPLPPNSHIPVNSGDISVALLCPTANRLMGKDDRRIV